MSEYLSNIVSRNAGSPIPELSPPVPMFSVPGANVDDGLAQENELHPAIQNLSAPQTNAFLQPGIPKKEQPAAHGSIEKRAENNPTDTGYFSKHIDRAVNQMHRQGEKKSTVQADNFTVEKPLTTGSSTTAEDRIIYKGEIVDKTILKIEPAKAGHKQTHETATKQKVATQINEPVDAQKIIFATQQIIQPGNSAAELKAKKSSVYNALNTVHITPNQTANLNERPGQNNRVKEVAPKLIIGKITVEMLPPKMQVPQKIITRIAQSTPKDSQVKSNKLIFGLGQL